VVNPSVATVPPVRLISSRVATASAPFPVPVGKENVTVGASLQNTPPVIHPGNRYADVPILMVAEVTLTPPPTIG